MISQSTPFAESALQGRLDWLDLGAGHARLEIYGGTRPASGAAPGVPVLVTFTLTKPAGTISSAILSITANAAYVLADNSGAPTWARWMNGNNEFAFDCDASGPAGSAEVVVSEALIIEGGKVSLLSALLA